MTKRYYFLILLCFTVAAASFGQEQKIIDSLHNQLKQFGYKQNDARKSFTKENGEAIANTLDELSRTYWAYDNEKALDYAKQNQTFSERIQFEEGIANALNSEGVIAWYKGDYEQSLALQQKALTIRLKLNNKKGIASCYNNIGMSYYSQDNYPEALKYYFISLKIREELKDEDGLASSYLNIANIYKDQGNYDDALKNYTASLKILQDLDDKESVAMCYTNIGMVYQEQGDTVDNNSKLRKEFFQKAIHNYNESKKIYQSISFNRGIARVSNCVGVVFSIQALDSNASELDRTSWRKIALENFEAAKQIYKESGSMGGLALAYSNIGHILVQQKKYQEAKQYILEALSISTQNGDLSTQQLCYKNLSTLYRQQNQYKEAFTYYQLYIQIHDSIFNEENTEKSIQQKLQYDFDKKESQAKAQQDKKDALQKLIRNVLIAGLCVMLLFAFVFFRQRNNISKEKKKSDDLLLNILPAEVAEELKNTGNSEARDYELATVMFTDFKDFTKISEQLSPAKLLKEINYCFSEFDKIIQRHNIEKIKTIGDAYMCAGGLPVKNETHVKDTVQAAIEIRDFMNAYNQNKVSKGLIPFEIRIGINTGPLVAGIVGVKKFAYDIWGDTVNIASRMESNGEVGKVNISGATYELVKNSFSCSYRGKIDAKNKGEIDMYFVERSEIPKSGDERSEIPKGGVDRSKNPHGVVEL